MKKLLLSLSLFLGMCSIMFGQLKLPQPSMKASVMQTVGLTDITIDYSSPAVNGRVIWGSLLPYDKLWRAGANAATKISFSEDVMIENVKVPKGEYSILMIPSQGDWTIILNKDANVYFENYKQEQDMVRIQVKPIALGTNFERLIYSFSDFDNTSTIVNMTWEKMNVSFKVYVMTKEQAEENIEKTVSSVWSVYNNSARYYYSIKEYDKALDYANKSIVALETWFNTWVKAQILFEKGNKSEAYVAAQKAKVLGDKNKEGFFFSSQVEKAIQEWSAFAPKSEAPASTSKGRKKRK